MSGHPEVPPNCPYFERDRKLFADQNPRWRFKTPLEDLYFDIASQAGWRPIVAAVAEKAWDKEARRLREQLPQCDG